MIPGLGGGLSVASTDQSSQAVNPVAGYISGGFSFAPQNSFGGKGTSQSSNPTLSTSQPLSAGGTPAASGGGGIDPNTLLILAGIGILGLVLAFKQ